MNRQDDVVGISTRRNCWTAAAPSAVNTGGPKPEEQQSSAVAAALPQEAVVIGLPRGGSEREDPLPLSTPSRRVSSEPLRRNDRRGWTGGTIVEARDDGLRAPGARRPADRARACRGTMASRARFAPALPTPGVRALVHGSQRRAAEGRLVA